MTTAVASTTGASATTSTSTASQISSGQSTLNSSYDTFLKLLTTQLQNQDPTSPMDTNAFTQQLVEMNGVQQQLLSNQLLQQLVTNSGGGQGVSSAVNMIGKTVVANTAQVNKTGATASWQYTLGSGAVSGTATITNSAGTAVWSGNLNALTTGANTFTWPGTDSSGRALPSGVYTLAISAQDAYGGSVSATPQVSGVVTSVQQNSAGQTVLGIGQTTVPVSTVTSVSTGA